MGARAVYASKCFAIYITGAELDTMLMLGFMTPGLELGGLHNRHAEVKVELDYEATQILRSLVDGERAAIEKGRAAAVDPGHPLPVDRKNKRSKHGQGQP